MASYTLEIDEFAALVGFLNAKKLVGMDESLFRSFSEENLPTLVAKLQGHGLLAPAERPGTYHFNEDLMQALAVAVSPDFAVLVRSKARPRSIVFYMAANEITEIGVTDESAVVVAVAGIDVLAAHAVGFLKDAWPGEIVVAKVEGASFADGRRAAFEEAQDVGTVEAFVRGAIASFSAKAG